MGKYTKSKTSRKTMKKKQMKKSKSLNNKKTHKKTGGIAGYDIRGKAAEGLKLNKDTFKLRNLNIVKGTKDFLFTEKKPVDIILQINQYGKPENISLNSNNYFKKEDNITETPEINFPDITIPTDKIDKLLLHKLQFRDEKFDQRLFKEYKVTYYEKNSKNETEDKSTLTGVGNSTGVYVKYNNINIQQKEATLRLPFIINKVFQAKTGSYGDDKADGKSIYMQYQVPLKWALEEYLNLNKYGVRETNNNTVVLVSKINLLFNCFDKDKDHVWDNEAWKFTEGAIKNITLNNVESITKDEEFKKCPKVSEIDNLLKLLTIKVSKDSDGADTTSGNTEKIWITITERVEDALIGVRSKTNLHDQHSNRIELFQTLPSDKKHSVTKTEKKEYIESVNFDARKIFNRQAEWSYKYRPSYNTNDKILAANNAQGFGLEKGYLYDVRSSFNIGKNIPSKEWLSTFPYNKLQENINKDLNESAENKK